jgi:hypothetical protein
MKQLDLILILDGIRSDDCLDLCNSVARSPFLELNMNWHLVGIQITCFSKKSYAGSSPPSHARSMAMLGSCH